MAERLKFGKVIDIKGKGELTVTSGDTMITIREKSPRVKPEKGNQGPKAEELVSNLHSLAMFAESGMGDSFDQSYYNDEIKKLKVKYPNEQPEEVWRRTLATMMAEGITIENVADALLSGNLAFRLSKELGHITREMENEKIDKLRDTISHFWPTPKSRK